MLVRDGFQGRTGGTVDGHDTGSPYGLEPILRPGEHDVGVGNGRGVGGRGYDPGFGGIYDLFKTIGRLSLLEFWLSASGGVGRRVGRERRIVPMKVSCITVRVRCGICALPRRPLLWATSDVIRTGRDGTLAAAILGLGRLGRGGEGGLATEARSPRTVSGMAGGLAVGGRAATAGARSS